ncbi:hypothetical protein FHX75_112084 [Micromonospora palomenae]|uniref:Uncharacterized protein n=1 Tax=Micromonospora palomenae TaxID=1461247 RepID=A0A561WYI2_9ACTN|nr:hypothetical protein [Micromonospora palomenae]TWG28925.1 hypothetical protein FHX75_112084 [Micromonospora palomenae]
MGNNLALLQLGDLARDLRFVSSALVTCGCKIPALVMVAGGAVISVYQALGGVLLATLRVPMVGRVRSRQGIGSAAPDRRAELVAILNQIGDAAYRRATRIMLLNAGLITPLALVAVPLAGPTGAAAATLAAEVLTAAVLGLAVLRRRGRLSAWIINPPPVGRARR